MKNVLNWEREGELWILLGNDFRKVVNLYVMKRVVSKGGTAFRNLELDTVTCMSLVIVRSLDN